TALERPIGRAPRRRASRRHGLDRSSSSTAPRGGAAGSSLDRRGEHWPKIEGRATERNRGSVAGSVPGGRVFIGAAGSRRGCSAASAQALDRDEFVAGGGAVGRRHRAGDLLALDPAKRRGFRVVAGLAIGGGNRRATGRAGGETAVDAIAVGIVGNDEGALFGLRRTAENGGRKDERGEQVPHS